MDLEALEHALSLPATAERFWRHVQRTETCWLWTGRVNHRGYGQFGLWIGGKSVKRTASRVAWILSVGPIPDGLWVLHDPLACNRPACVNPAHLRLGTASDNVRDTIIAGNHREVAKTACKNGHPYDGVVVCGGRRARICTQCRRAQQTESHRKLRARRRAEAVPHA